MKVSIDEIDKEKEEEVIIRCHELNNDILQLLDKIKSKNFILIGYENEKMYRIPLAEVYYFEAVDNKVFIYCKNKIFESKQKLYELEEACEGSKFFRASKSCIINVVKITYIRPSLSGRFEVNLSNDEKVMVSRQYVPVLKSMIGL